MAKAETEDPKRGRGLSLARRIVLATAGYVAAFFLIHLPHGPEHWSSDLMVNLISDRLPGQHPRIALVKITENSLPPSSYLEPLDRALLAAVISKVDAAGAKVIGLDLVFDRPTEAAKDQALRDAIQSAHSKIVVGQVDANESPQAFSLLASSPNMTRGHLHFGVHHSRLVVTDYVVREMVDEDERGGQISFAEALARADGDFIKPKSSHISWLLPPKNGDDTFFSLDASSLVGADALSPDLLKRLLAGRIVLVGGVFPDRDQHLTPLSVLNGRPFPGLYIQAQVVADMIDPNRRPLRDLSWLGWGVVVACTLAVGVVTGSIGALHRWRPLPEAAVLIALVLCSVLSGFVFRLSFPFVAAVIGWGLGETIASQVHVALEGEDERPGAGAH